MIWASPVTQASQHNVELAADQLFDEFARPSAHLGLDRIKPTVEKLETRFSIDRICVVADRGMISAETIDWKRKVQYDDNFNTHIWLEFNSLNREVFDLALKSVKLTAVWHHAVVVREAWAWPTVATGLAAGVLQQPVPPLWPHNVGASAAP